MKSVIFATLTTLASAAVLAPAGMTVAQQQEIIKGSEYLMAKSPLKNFALGKGSKKAAGAPASEVPEVSAEITSPQWSFAKRVSIRYGPYRLPAPSEKNWESMFMKVSGMADTFTKEAKKPCETCVILQSYAELQNNKGVAVKDAWLHHAGVMMFGEGLSDSMCGTPGVQGLFEQGNERTDLPLEDKSGGIKVGYHIKPHYKFLVSNELVNMNKEAQYVWNTVTYDYIPGENPDFKQAKSLLLTVGALPICTKGKNTHGASNLTVTGQPKAKVFTEHSIPWIAPYDGIVIGTGGHLHDGGLEVNVFHNDKLICNSRATYAVGKKSEESHGMGGGSYDANASHLATMSGCSVNQPIKKGDTLSLSASYDFNKHPGMEDNKGELDEVMGMAGVMIAA